jgi:NADH-quinone oxidoreductase subunit L
MKAFIVTRIGDVFLAIGLFILFQRTGHPEHPELMILAPQKFQVGASGSYLGDPDAAGWCGR